MKLFDVLVVGGGPVGSVLARDLAREGFSVAIIEKKPVPGKEACSGLVSNRFLSLVPLAKRTVLEHVRGVVFHGDKESLRAVSTKPLGVVVDRPRLDNLLFNQAVADGVTTFTSTTFQDYTLLSDCVVAHTSGGSIHARVLVGADGPASTVRRAAGLDEGIIQVVNCGLYRTKRKEGEEKGVVSLYFDPQAFRGFFGWKIPRGEKIEIGAGIVGGDPGLPLRVLSSMLGYDAPHNPLYSPVVYGILKRTATDRVLLVGDAACQTKPFSGGGLTYGVLCSRIASRAIKEGLDSGDTSSSFFEEKYHEEWRRHLLNPILAGLGLRRLFDSLSTAEIDTLLSLARNLSSDLVSRGDMDLVSALAF